MEGMIEEVCRIAAVMEKLPLVQRLRTQVERLNQMATSEACKCEAAERETSGLRLELAGALFATEVEREAHDETRRQRDGWSRVATRLAEASNAETRSLRAEISVETRRANRAEHALAAVQRAEPGLVAVVPYA